MKKIFPGRRRIWLAGAILLVLAVFVLITRGPADPSPDPPGTFAFASPDVGWVRVVVTPGAAQPFAFEKRVVPGWSGH